MTVDEHRNLIDRLATRTVELIGTEYPNVMRLSLFEAPTEPVTPRGLHPSFFGCYDWHSAVHSHWQLVRAMRLAPDAPFVPAAIEVLGATLTAENIAAEMRWIEPHRLGFEMPYGMAWLLALCDELRHSIVSPAAEWLAALAPMETHAVGRFRAYCAAMVAPVRGGMHNQTAFALALARDHADAIGDADLRESIDDATHRFFFADIDVDLRHEPSAADFLSPALAEADLIRRVLVPDEFARWLERFAPDGFGALAPVTVVDASDGQLAHWAGLNLSRSWMMSDIATALSPDHAHLPSLLRSARDHADVGLRWCDHDDIMISHWVPTFALRVLAAPAS